MTRPISPRPRNAIPLVAAVLLFLQAALLSPPAALAQSPRSGRGNPEILQGIDLIYNNRLMEAEALFSEMTAKDPDKPASYFYLAMVSWSRLTNGFWGRDTVGEYKARIERAVKVGRSRVERHSKDSYDYFYLGGALGFQGRFELMQQDYVSSFFLAKEAVEMLETCQRMDPGNRDVLLGLGTFDYYTDRLSGILKFLTNWFIRKGSREDGLRKLEAAAEEAVYSATEAKSLLLHIYLFLEKKDALALALARALSEKYADNDRYRYLAGVCCIRMGLESEYRAILRDFVARGSQKSAYPSAMWWQRRTLYLEATYDLFAGRYGDARKKLGAILSLPDMERDPGMIAWPRIKLGMSYDLEGKRNEAEAYYNQVLDMENGSGAQFLEKRLLNGPPEKNDPFIGY
jgi:tetratricopeptide (TPR) repeat protein